MNAEIKAIIQRALREDMPKGDLSSESLFHDETSEARILAKEDGILSGIAVAAETFFQIDPEIIVRSALRRRRSIAQRRCRRRFEGPHEIIASRRTRRPQLCAADVRHRDDDQSLSSKQRRALPR
ncbi:MAG: hypothetical protein MZU97_25760 [Bacillus subtilis]|nr:hypothetical protein [Bacillus subtilis]